MCSDRGGTVIRANILVIFMLNNNRYCIPFVLKCRCRLLSKPSKVLLDFTSSPFFVVLWPLYVVNLSLRIG